MLNILIKIHNSEHYFTVSVVFIFKRKCFVCCCVAPAPFLQALGGKRGVVSILAFVFHLKAKTDRCERIPWSDFTLGSNRQVDMPLGPCLVLQLDFCLILISPLFKMVTTNKNKFAAQKFQKLVF